MTGIKIDQSQLKELQKAIAGTPRKLEKEYRIAINATAGKAKGFIAKQVSQRIKVTQANVKGRVMTVRATTANQSASVRLQPMKRIPLRDFGARQTRAGLTYKIDKDKNTSRGSIKSGFLVQSLGGHAFARRGSKRLPIDKLYGPSPWGVFVKGQAIKPTTEQTQQELSKQIKKRIQFINFKKAGG